MEYRWKPGSRVVIKAQVAGEEIERIREACGDNLKPANVVKAARKRRSPIHDAFEWDDATAAQERREDQARYMLRSLTVIIEESPESGPTRAFVTIEIDDSERYMAIGTVLMSSDLRAQLLTRAKRELIAWQRRYAELHELAAVFAAIETVKGREAVLV